jgi:hypothetical protein
MKKPSNSEYTRRANLLRKVGYKLGWKGNDASTHSKGAKAAITKYWENKGVFYLANPEKNRLEFKRFRSPSSRRKWAELAADEQVFPGGVFVQRPKGFEKGEWTIKLGKKGLYIKSGNVRDIVLKLDMVDVARDPKKALEKTLKGHKRPADFMLTSNGFDRAAGVFSDLEMFNRYLEESLIPDLEEKDFDFEEYGKRVFGLRLIYTPKGRKKKKGEGKTFDFDTGGIFDESSKRVYGIKKFLGVRVPRGGKRKRK